MRADTPADIGHARRLFQAYADGLPIDLVYQDFAGELATRIAGTIFLGLAPMPDRIRSGGHGEWHHSPCLPS